jgi:hypothetical protein
MNKRNRISFSSFSSSLSSLRPYHHHLQHRASRRRHQHRINQRPLNTHSIKEKSQLDRRSHCRYHRMPSLYHSDRCTDTSVLLEKTSEETEETGWYSDRSETNRYIEQYTHSDVQCRWKANVSFKQYESPEACVSSLSCLSASSISTLCLSCIKEMFLIKTNNLGSNNSYLVSSSMSLLSLSMSPFVSISVSLLSY